MNPHPDDRPVTPRHGCSVTALADVKESRYRSSAPLRPMVSERSLEHPTATRTAHGVALATCRETR